MPGAEEAATAEIIGLLGDRPVATSQPLGLAVMHILARREKHASGAPQLTDRPVGRTPDYWFKIRGHGLELVRVVADGDQRTGYATVATVALDRQRRLSGRPSSLPRLM
ncbi:hypothetical protein GCM10009733_106080 [Nonomuraea maheshkhaliensis]|uniref:Uncharacterized protein n=1 Tax=Nonomuraea maheshkhaliensis TaxID=419590 RepID=A0ABP4TT73_9ACTN